MTRISQLRIYTIQEGRLDEFVGGWRNGVVPLRRKHGFTVGAAWTSREKNRFVWILSYDGPESWESKTKAYYESDERKAIDPDPAKLITDQMELFISPVSD
jgi:hypothetical protein